MFDLFMLLERFKGYKTTSQRTFNWEIGSKRNTCPKFCINTTDRMTLANSLFSSASVTLTTTVYVFARNMAWLYTTVG